MSGFIRAPALTPLEPVRLSDEDRVLAHMAASVLLDYPEADRTPSYPLVREAVAHLRPPVRQRFWTFLDHAEEVGQQALAAHYVETFDQKRRRSEEHTSELQSRGHLVCRLLLEKKKQV